MQSILRAKCAKLPQLFQLIIKRPSPRVNQVKLVIHLTESAHTSTKKESCWMILHFIHAEPCIITTCRSAMCSQRSTILLHTLAFVAECSSHTPWGPPSLSGCYRRAIPAHLRLLWWLPQLKQQGTHTGHGQGVHTTIHLHFIPPVWTSLYLTPTGTCDWQSQPATSPNNARKKQICFNPSVVPSFAERLNQRKR